jgi:cytochrome c-type biogenesis protein CcsB
MAVPSILLLIFAVAAGVATFIENDYGTQTARALVYNAKWFEAVMVLLAISLGFNIFKQKLYTKEKIGSFLMHSSFIVILIGAGLTRYFGYEGVMHVREAETSNKMISADTYLQISAVSGASKSSVEEKVLFASTEKPDFKTKIRANGKEYSISLKEIIPNAVKQIEEIKGGKPMISMVVAADGATPSQRLLEDGISATIENIKFEIGNNGSLIEGDAPSVKFFVKDSKIYFISNRDVEYLTMLDRQNGKYAKNEINEFEKGKLFNIEGVSFVPRYTTISGAVKLMPSSSKMKGQSLDSALIFDVKGANTQKTVTVMGQSQAAGEPVSIALEDANITLAYGSRILELPISIKLNKFTLSRYPGSMSPSSYESNVTVVEGANSFDYRIYMNHTLDANGFRFFQSSYDSDEKGTILSVSKDPGKIPTYIGYLMMAIGMGWLLIDKNSRFRKLSKTLETQKASISAVLIMLFAFLTPNIYAADNASQIDGMQAANILQNAKSVNKEVADDFGRLLVQDAQGRLKPINTLAIEVLDKVSGSSSFDGMSANETLFAMILEPKSWQQIKFIKVSHPEVKKFLGLGDTDKRAAFTDFFDTTNAQGGYKLATYVDEANRKKPSDRGTLDKEILKLDEKLNICYMVYSGKLLRIFPKPNDSNNLWLDPASAVIGLDVNSSNAIRENLNGLFSNAILSTKDSIKTAAALSEVAKIKMMQETYGKSIIPSDTKISVELLYNKLNVFFNLIFVYLLVGLLLLVAEFATLSGESKALKIVKTSSLYILTAAFALHTLNLAARWYISGHAPWSDGYESMTYIAWATTLAGILFTKKSTFTLALTSILAGVVLFVAHLSWMDPQITNIVPVLKSYWLTIHVSMITASYGFLGLGALIGFVSLILFALRSESKPLIDKKIRELAVINEMTLIVGLFMLTVGNFLGGVWANESWGRYWGWDPKETWALVSILIYTIVVHSKYIPKMGSPYALSVLSMFSFSSIVMTYFGVNFYLSGLHSYAQGDPIPVPSFVYISVVVMVLVTLLAYKQRDLKLLKAED